MQLKQLGTIDLQQLTSLNNVDVLSFDLLVIPADHVTKDHFGEWLARIYGKMNIEKKIWVPALIMT